MWPFNKKKKEDKAEDTEVKCEVKLMYFDPEDLKNLQKIGEELSREQNRDKKIDEILK